MPCTDSQSSVGTISIASHGQPSRNAPSGPLLVHFWQPIHKYGSTSIRPKGGWSSSGSQYIQASIGQYSMHAGEPEHPVQQSVVIARMRGFFLRVALPSPSDIGQCFSTMSYKCKAPNNKLTFSSTLTYLFRFPKRFVSINNCAC
jgi:hypothetical protein